MLQLMSQIFVRSLVVGSRTGDLKRLEPYEGKLSRTVLRGGSDSNIISLPDTLMQAARRSWRIGQKHPVTVTFFGYAESSQMTCLALMAKKIAVSQSTSGDIPESGLDSLNSDAESIDMALARQLVA